MQYLSVAFDMDSKKTETTEQQKVDVISSECKEDIDEDDENNISAALTLTQKQQDELGLNKTVIAAIRDVFKSLDEDDSGTLDISELAAAMKSLGIDFTVEEVEELVRQADADGNGTLDFFEFAKMVSEKMRAYDSEKQLREAFAEFDKDGDGKISVEEIRTVVESLGEHMTEEELEGMLHEADDNNDGYLDYAEFVKIWLGEEPLSTK